jgi:hypothetical protein
VNRRDLNRILMVGTALAGGWPAWLRRAFGADAASGRECAAPDGREGVRRWRQIVSSAYRRAQQAGKPLLAFVVPPLEDEEREEGWGELIDRGRAFGELLNHGGDDALATLALAEVVCAPMTALRALVPSLPGGHPLMVLLETDGVPARARALDAKLPQLPAWGDDTGLGLGVTDSWQLRYATSQRRDRTWVGQRIRVLATLLDGALRATPQMLLERAAQSQARLGLAPAPGATGRSGPAEIHRMAAVLLAAAVGLPDGERRSAVAQVAESARFVLCRRRVPGSRWANSTGCGVDVERLPDETEPDEGRLVNCGMGHVPEQSSRFLDFLARDARWRS